MYLDFEVTEIWKGPRVARRRVLTGFGGGDCGIGARTGDELLVYAGVEGGTAYTNLCTRTTAITSAGVDLARLGPGSGPDPAPVRWGLLLPLGLVFLAGGGAYVVSRSRS